MGAHFSEDAHRRSWTLILVRTLMDGHGRSWTLMDAHFSTNARWTLGGRDGHAMVMRRSRSRFRTIRTTVIKLNYLNCNLFETNVKFLYLSYFI